MTSSPIRTFSSESPNLHVRYKDPFIFQSGNLDVRTWNPSFCDEALTFSSSKVKFIVWAYSDASVRFRLEYSPFNEEIQKQLKDAGITCYGVGNHTTDRYCLDQLQKIYQVMIQKYGINDPAQVVQQLAKWGSYHFPELHLQSESWNTDPTRLNPKRMEFANHDLKLVISGHEDGSVRFEVQALHHEGVLKDRLIESGINLSPYYYGRFEAKTPEQLQKVYQMLCKHYPIMNHCELMERLAWYGNWKKEEASRSIPLEHIQQRA